MESSESSYQFINNRSCLVHNLTVALPQVSRQNFEPACDAVFPNKDIVANKETAWVEGKPPASIFSFGTHRHQLSDEQHRLVKTGSQTTSSSSETAAAGADRRTGGSKKKWTKKRRRIF